MITMRCWTKSSWLISHVIHDVMCVVIYHAIYLVMQYVIYCAI